VGWGIYYRKRVLGITGDFFWGASLWVMIDLNDLRSGRLSSMEYDDVLAVSLILFMFSTSTTDIRSW